MPLLASNSSTVRSTIGPFISADLSMPADDVNLEYSERQDMFRQLEKAGIHEAIFDVMDFNAKVDFQGEWANDKEAREISGKCAATNISKEMTLYLETEANLAGNAIKELLPEMSNVEEKTLRDNFTAIYDTCADFAHEQVNSSGGQPMELSNLKIRSKLQERKHVLALTNYVVKLSKKVCQGKIDELTAGKKKYKELYDVLKKSAENAVIIDDYNEQNSAEVCHGVYLWPYPASLT